MHRFYKFVADLGTRERYHLVFHPSPPAMIKLTCCLSTFLFLTLSPALAQPLSDQTNLKQGLEVNEYPRHEKQTSHDTVFLDSKQFGDPIGGAYLVKSLTGWKHATERNAVARGYLRIEKAGDYSFMTDSFYDRNVLKLNGKVVCKFSDGATRVNTVTLKKGLAPIESVGYVDGRGGTQGVRVRWKTPDQREFSDIPAELLLHHGRQGLTFRDRVVTPPSERTVPANLRARWMTVVAKDFVIEVYRNGRRIPDSSRKMLLDRYGSTAERINVEVRAGDWLVFHVAHNRLRHRGSRFFAVAGSLDENQFGFVSSLESEAWSVCDDPGRSREFIRHRDEGTEARAMPIQRQWEEGMKFMKRYTGKDFPGDALWGAAPSTWIKFIVPEKGEPMAAAKTSGPEALTPVVANANVDSRGNWQALGDEAKADAPGGRDAKKHDKTERLGILDPARPRVQVLSAIYGTGGKDADVTERVKDLVEVKRSFFAANPGHLKVDPNPYWNKALRITYMKDGVRRHQHRNENEHILPESFYGPQDAAELAQWIEGTRWQGPRGEVQFHANGLLAGPELKQDAEWKALAAGKLQIKWSPEDGSEFQCDYTWSSFRAPGDGKNTYRLMK